MTVSRRTLLSCLAGLAVLALGSAVLIGSGSAGPGTLLDLALGRADRTEVDILIRLRLPRVLAAFGTGAALSLAGVLMQVLLRNPLADPYLLGTSGGAAVAAITAIILGAGRLVVDASAFAGALFSIVLVFGLARGAAFSTRLLLTGVVVAAGWSALVSLLLVIGPDASLRGILFWLMGDFSFARSPVAILSVAAAMLVAATLLGRSLNVLATGDAQAAALGLDVGRMRSAVYAGGALLTAIAVTTGGVVGFVGLVVPHLVRLAGGSDHRTLVPAAALAGGALVVFADTLARTLLAPRQLPVGAITAMIGVPLFVLLLQRSRRPL